MAKHLESLGSAVGGVPPLPPSETTKMLPAQSRAARALIEWTRTQLAEAAGVPRSTVIDFETGRKIPPQATIDAIRHALETGGVVLIPDNGGGAGVRLKVSRRDVRRIATLEDEGGPIRDDDI